MTNWHAIRCKTGYEFDVAQAILNMGLDVQCPVQVRVIQARRKNQRHRLVRPPAIPGWLFAEAGKAADGNFTEIGGYIAVLRDSRSVALEINSRAMSEFLAHIDAHNRRMERYFKTLTEGKTARKPRLVLKGFDGLDEALDRMQKAEAE